METKSSDRFKKGIDNAFSKLPELNNTTMGDANEYKRNFNENKLEGGVSDKMSLSDIAKKHKVKLDNLKTEFKKGVKVEMEHTKDLKVAKEIAKDHLFEDPKYYSKLKKVENKESTSTGSSGAFVSPINFSNDFIKRSNAENKRLTKESEIEKVETTEATGSGSSGAYETPAAWAKSTNKKDWGGKKKTQIPGGKFVTIKKRCKKFPYCNQGDIKALHLYENKSLQDAIKNVSNKLNLDETVIKSIIEFEFEKILKKK